MSAKRLFDTVPSTALLLLTAPLLALVAVLIKLAPIRRKPRNLRIAFTDKAQTHFGGLYCLQIVRMTARAKSSHVGGGLSMAEIPAVLYGSVLGVDPARPDWEARDRFVLSRGAR